MKMMKHHLDLNSIIIVGGILCSVWMAGCSVKPTVHRSAPSGTVADAIGNRLGWYLLDGHDEEEGAVLYSYLLLPARPLTQSEILSLAHLWKVLRSKQLNQKPVQFYFPVNSRDRIEMEKMESNGQWASILGRFHGKRCAVMLSRLNNIELEQPLLVLGLKPLGQLAKDRNYRGDLILLLDYSKLREDKRDAFNKWFSKELLDHSKAIVKKESFEPMVKRLRPYFDESSDQAIHIVTLTD